MRVFERARRQRDGHVREVAFGERVHPVVVDAGIEGVGHQHRVVDGGYAHAVLGKDLGVVLHVLADLEDGVILEDRFEGGEHGVGVFGDGDDGVTMQMCNYARLLDMRSALISAFRRPGKDPQTGHFRSEN